MSLSLTNEHLDQAIEGMAKAQFAWSQELVKCLITEKDRRARAGRPIEFDDAKHKKMRENARNYRAKLSGRPRSTDNGGTK